VSFKYFLGMKANARSGRARAVARETNPIRPCLCGKSKYAGHVVCLTCWRGAPQSARDHFQHLSTRRVGARELKAFALSQRKEVTT